MINSLWLIPAFLVGLFAGFSCAYFIAWAFEKACRDLRRWWGLE